MFAEHLQARRKRPNSPKKTPISKKSADRDALIDAIASINASSADFSETRVVPRVLDGYQPQMSHTYSQQ